MENSFFTWLNNQVSHRGWSNNELARRAGISSSSISMVINGQRGITAEFCQAIAYALNMSPEIVYRQAGLLPPSRDELRAADPIYDEACTILERLNDTLRLSALAMLRGLANATGFAPPQTALPEMSPGYTARPAEQAPPPAGLDRNDGGSPVSEIEQKFYPPAERALPNDRQVMLWLFDAWAKVAEPDDLLWAFGFIGGVIEANNARTELDDVIPESALSGGETNG